MKFSERRFSPLRYLDWKKNDTNIGIVREDQEELLGMGESFIPKIRKLIHGIDQKNIINPSAKFEEAASLSLQKNLFQYISDNVDLLDGMSGVILRKDSTIFYRIDKVAEQEDAKAIVSFVAIKNIENTLVAFSLASNDGSRLQQMWFSNLFLRPPSGEIMDRRKLTEIQYLYIYTIIMSVVLFKRFAPVETKEFFAGQKTKYEGHKCINETKYNITYLDSKWFTNIVRSAGFGVKGHFRLQPCGVGMKDRRLIWIEAFEKTGYTAPARKLKATDQ